MKSKATLTCVLGVCALCTLLKFTDGIGAQPRGDGFNGKNILTLAISGNMFRDKAGNVLTPASGENGMLTAQLFDGLGGGNPIWTETQEAFSFRLNDGKTVVTLGEITPFKVNGEAIPFNNSPIILLTYQLNGKDYTAPRFAIAITGYSHQAGSAFEATGELKTKINDYEMRIKTLEKTNNEIVNKMYRELYGSDPPVAGNR
jgi:hypothetical protein